MRVWLDAQRMASRGLPANDVENAIRRENAEIPAGRVEGSGREFSVRTRGDLVTAEEFGAIIVRQAGDETVRLRDVAQVERGAEDERTAVRYNGLPAIGLGIIKQQKASTIDVAEVVVSELPELRKLVPEGMTL